MTLKLVQQSAVGRVVGFSRDALPIDFWMAMIDWTEIPDGDTWELFARDFLTELGFVIDVGPGRGSDAGRDLIVSEQLRGRLNSRKFTWLVSCKHLATSGVSVGPDKKSNISDRLKQHGADGFMGFYSTMPSSGLVERLRQMSSSGQVGAYELFDGRKIEEHFVETGMSKLALRYVPASYGRMRPMQKFFGEYQALNCEVCGADILAVASSKDYAHIVQYASLGDDFNRVDSVHFACKGACDQRVQARLWATNHITSWEDITDLLNPIFFLRNMLTYMNLLHDGPVKYSSEAHEQIKKMYVAIAQRTLREVTKEDENRFGVLGMIEGF